MTYIGIDPGNKGAIAILEPDKPMVIYKMPAEHQREELLKLMETIAAYPFPKVAIEKQILKPVGGKKPCPFCKKPISYAYMQAGVATTFRNYGILLGLMYAYRIPYEEIDGSTWKKLFKLTKLGKEGSIKLAKQFFPYLSEEIGEDDNKAEAALLAEYGRRQC